MARIIQSVILLAGTLCLLSLAGIAHSVDPKFIVKGQVFCDVCRANFTNDLSESMPGATVRLQCRAGEDDKNVTYSLDGVTNDKGEYNLDVTGDHEKEICDVSLVKSSRADCNEIPSGGWATTGSIVTLTSNSGMHDHTRTANPLAFLKKVVPSQCATLLKSLQADLDD